jgi:uncharacterized protein
MSDTSTLCRSCALCCDGSLFSFVTVPASEARGLRGRGLALTDNADGTCRLSQRCGGLEGRTCSIYSERPAPCRSYSCLLATSLREGELSLAETLAIVEGAHVRLSTLATALGADSSPSPVSQLRALLAAGGTPDELTAKAWSDVSGYLRRHFTGRSNLRFQP